MLKINRLYEAFLDEMDIITVLLPKSYHGGVATNFYLCKDDVCSELEICEIIDLGPFIKYVCQVNLFIEIGAEYSIVDNVGNKTDLQIGAVIRTQEFDEAYYYRGDDLGPSYSKEHTKFKVWAPTATNVKLRVYHLDGYVIKEYDMIRRRNGVWKQLINEDCDGMIYTYMVCVNLVWREAVDPYVKTTTSNGARGVVINLNRTRTVSPSPMPMLTHFTDAVIYEASIRDLTKHSSSRSEFAGKYLGLTKTAEDIGISYFKRLGITHLELLPFNDFEGIDEENPDDSYNWGYNPLHFNVPEGSYSLYPQDPYSRVNELKELISCLHESGLRIIMDVVYNHVYIRETSSFECIVPGYYFRHDENGMPSNGTGVGNDIASERKMVRKFILDSIMYWITEYKVDGIRFDLMGILDVETMNEIRRVLDDYDENIMTIGEGWDLMTPLPLEQKAALFNSKKMRRIGFFNDVFRDCVKGSTFSITERGYALGDEWKHERMKLLLAGSVPFIPGIKGMFNDPNQSINYVECHDNYTLWDKLAVSNSEESEEERKKRQMLATAMVILAQGVPFLHSGQEFFRTKKGVENSYNASDDINNINWDEMRINEEFVNYISALIQLRKDHGALRLWSTALIQKHVSYLHSSGKCIAYLLKDVSHLGRWNDLMILFNNSRTEEEISLENVGEWQVIVEDGKVNVEGIRLFNQEKIVLSPISTTILVRW